MDMNYRMTTVTPSLSLKRIVSGGQTGVDRGALDAALGVDFPCGGWVPGDRMAEDGVISDRYPLMALPDGDYQQRTRLNVVDSDGTRLTRDLCKLLGRPCTLINAREIPDPGAAAESILKFIANNNIETLNVAGPRASGWQDGYAFALGVVGQVLTKQAAPDCANGAE